MIFKRQELNTAGVYISINGQYVFAIGKQLHNDQIPVIWLGGHLEANETGWQCAQREVLEEANLKIKPIFPKATYLYDWNGLENEPQTIKWQHEDKQDPCLVITYHREGEITLSLMYFACTDDTPIPSSEIKGLLLLQETEIHRICEEPTTLQQYLDSGGNAILKENFDTSLYLEPFIQLRLLSRFLNKKSLED